MREHFSILSKYPSIKVTEAYTNVPLGNCSIYSDGTIRKGIGNLDIDIKLIRLQDVAEIRYRADETPEMYYETKNSKKMV